MARSAVSHIGSRISEESLRLAKGLYRGVLPYRQSSTTVFVGGVQRSGTNMFMELLDRSFATQVFHEHDERALHHSELRESGVLLRLVERSGSPVVAMKALCDLDRFRALLDEFEPAKGFWLVRDYPDVVNSHLALWRKMPFFLGEVLRDPHAGGEAGWRGRGLSPEAREILQRHYHPDMDNATACALFWYLRNTLLFDQHLQDDDRVAIVRYEDIVADPANVVPRLWAFAGVPYREWSIRPVSAGSIRKKPAPDIEPSVRELCDGLQQRLHQVLRVPA